MCETYNKSSLEEVERQYPQYKSQKHWRKDKRLRKCNYNYNYNYNCDYDYGRDSRSRDRDRSYSRDRSQDYYEGDYRKENYEKVKIGNIEVDLEIIMETHAMTGT